MKAIVAGLCAAALSSCAGGVLEQGRSPGYVVIDSMAAASGAEPGTFGSVLASDVVTNVKQTIDGKEVRVPTVFEDPGQVTAHLNLKNIGTVDSPTAPTSNNAITIDRYHVSFARSDGRNTPGVDVPYAFDGAVTATVSDSNAIVFGFTLVRAQAKEEAPLMSLRNGGGSGIISTIATITFYGHDQAGHDVSVTGTIGVNFADWGDPE
jgi:hypothetical protein